MNTVHKISKAEALWAYVFARGSEKSHALRHKSKTREGLERYIAHAKLRVLDQAFYVYKAGGWWRAIVYYPTYQRRSRHVAPLDGTEPMDHGLSWRNLRAT